MIMVVKMFVMLFGMSMAWILGAAIAQKLIMPIIDWYGLKVSVWVIRKIKRYADEHSNEVVYMRPGQAR